jgi:transcriptional regulator with XRE-family HTH domain
MTESTQIELGKILKEAREKKAYTLRQLGEKTEITYSYISAVERGKYLPSKDKLIRLSDALDLNKEDLLVLAGFSPVEEESVKSYLGIFERNNRYNLEGLSERIFLERYALKDEVSEDGIWIEGSRRNQKRVKKEDDFFYYDVTDSSMEGEGIKKGYKVQIKVVSEIENGKIGLVSFKGDKLLRRVFHMEDKIFLQATQGYAPKLVPKRKARILGQAVKVEFNLE